jgi:hypothetical protein
MCGIVAAMSNGGLSDERDGGLPPDVCERTGLRIPECPCLSCVMNHLRRHAPEHLRARLHAEAGAPREKVESGRPAAIPSALYLSDLPPPSLWEFRSGSPIGLSYTVHLN